MKTRTCALALSLILARAVSAGEVLVTASTVDVYSDGRKETVSLVMTSGKKYDDSDAPWCGSGLKYEGYFAISVGFPDGRQTTTNIFDYPVFFYARPWSIHFTDYNRDGILDFNLWEYAGCNGSGYTLFSFKPDGKVFEIGKASLDGHDNSTSRIKTDDRGYSDSYYSNGIGGSVETFYEWDRESQRFVPYRRIDCHDCLGSHRIRQVESIFNKTVDDFEPVKETESVYNPETGEIKVIKERSIRAPNQALSDGSRLHFGPLKPE